MGSSSPIFGWKFQKYLRNPPRKKVFFFQGRKKPTPWNHPFPGGSLHVWRTQRQPSFQGFGHDFPTHPVTTPTRGHLQFVVPCSSCQIWSNPHTKRSSKPQTWRMPPWNFTYIIIYRYPKSPFSIPNHSFWMFLVSMWNFGGVHIYLYTFDICHPIMDCKHRLCD